MNLSFHGMNAWHLLHCHTANTYAKEKVSQPSSGMVSDQRRAASFFGDDRLQVCARDRSVCVIAFAHPWYLRENLVSDRFEEASVDLGQMTSKEKLAKELPRGVFDCLVAEEIELVTKFALFLLQQRHSAGDHPVSNGREHHVLTRGKGQLQIFDDRCLVLCRGRSVRLAPKAHRMLLLLAQSDTTVSHDFLRQTLWPGLAATSRALPVHVCNLRRELEIDPNDPKLILTNHGQGYYLER